jgi:hypothetical protein
MATVVIGRILRLEGIGATMAVDERARLELYEQLARVLGTEAATTLLEHLPPGGWSDVATTRDLDQLERRIALRFDASDARIEAAEQRMLAVFRGELVTAITTQTRTMIFTMAGTVVSLAAVALTATRVG